MPPPASSPAPRVSITRADLVGGVQTATTDGRGEYRFGLLPPGVYDVAVSADRIPPRSAGGRARGVRRDRDHRPVSLEVSGIDRRSRSSAANSPVVDVKSAAVPIRLDEALLQNLPTSRSITDIMNLAPGIAADVAFGGSQRGNEILLDGVRTTDPLFQEPVVRGNYNWVQEMNVVSLGAPAEYGGFTGAAGYASLRSGANRFSGLGEFWTTQPSWLSNNTGELSETLQTRFDSRRIEDWYDTSAQVGGPILRDRLFFFAGLQQYRYNDKPAGYSGPGTTDERDLQTICQAHRVGVAERASRWVHRGRPSQHRGGLSRVLNFRSRPRATSTIRRRPGTRMRPGRSATPRSWNCGPAATTRASTRTRIRRASWTARRRTTTSGWAPGRRTPTTSSGTTPMS